MQADEGTRSATNAAGNPPSGLSRLLHELQNSLFAIRLLGDAVRESAREDERTIGEQIGAECERAATAIRAFRSELRARARSEEAPEAAGPEPSTAPELARDLRYEFSYRFCRFVLPIASIAAATGVLAVPLMASGLEMWVMMSACGALLTLYEYLRRRGAARVATRAGLNLLAAAILLPGAAVNFASLIFEGGAGPAVGTMGLIMGAGLAFPSAGLYVAMVVVSLGSWFAVSIAFAPPTPAHWVQVGLLSPILATGIRIGARRGYFELAKHRDRERRLLTDLRATVRRLREERAGREASDLLLYDAQKSESLGLLAGGVAHDFNNFLLAIVAFADSALSRPGNESNRNAVKQIKVTALGAADICQQMLTYAGRSTNERERIDLRDVVAQLKPLLAASLSKSIELEFDLGPRAPIAADQGQVRQAVMNLVLNAAEAMGPEGGRIRVTTLRCSGQTPPDAHLALEAVEAEAYHGVRVEDRGVGLERARMRQMFDPYYTTKTSGHGLGLAVTLGIMRHHGGAVRVSSRPGEGTAVELLFPEADARTRLDAEEARGGASPTSDTRVLLVDDEPVILRAVSSMLEANGYRVTAADGGAGALEAMARHEFDVVVLDYAMPGMTGVEAMREIRKSYPDVPVILSSGYMMGADSGVDALYEADAFIEKPYTVEQLTGLIGSVLHGETANADLHRGA